MKNNIGADPDTCKHPPHRVYTSIVPEYIECVPGLPAPREIMQFGCCDCGTSWHHYMPTRRMTGSKRDRATQGNVA